MNRTKKFFYNSLAAVFFQIVLIITGFIIPKVMLINYGSEINGLIASINQFIIYFTLVEAGLSTAAIYSLYKPLAENNHAVISGVVSAAKKFYFQVGYIFVSLTLGLSILYPYFVKTDLLNPLNMSLLVLILGVNGALEFFTLAKYRVILTADQRNYIVSIASIIHLCVYTLIIVFLANNQVNIVIVLFVALFSIFLRSIILMGYVRFKYKYINYKESPLIAALSNRWDALYLQILGAVQVGAPIVILTIFTKDLMLVSVYSVYSLVSNGLRGVLNIFKSGISASFGDIIARNQLLTLQKAFREFEVAYYFAITIIFSVALVTIMPFIKIYTMGVDDINYYMPIVGGLFILDAILYSIKNPHGTIIISAGMFKETKVQTTIQGLIVIIVGSVLVNFFGIIGVLIGSILSNIYRTIDMLVFVPNRITKLKITESALRHIRVLMSIVVIVIPVYFIEFNITGYFSLVIFAISMTIYAMILTTIIWLAFDKDVMKGIIKRFNIIFRK